MTTPREPEATSLGEALKRAQGERGLNQTEAAAAVGVSRSVFSRWINGGSLPSIHNIGSVAEFLGVEEGDVLAMFPPGYRLQAGRKSSVSEFAEVFATVRALTATVDHLVASEGAVRAEIAALRKVVEVITEHAEHLRQD